MRVLRVLLVMLGLLCLVGAAGSHPPRPVMEEVEVEDVDEEWDREWQSKNAEVKDTTTKSVVRSFWTSTRCLYCFASLIAVCTAVTFMMEKSCPRRLKQHNDIPVPTEEDKQRLKLAALKRLEKSEESRKAAMLASAPSVPTDAPGAATTDARANVTAVKARPTVKTSPVAKASPAAKSPATRTPVAAGAPTTPRTPSTPTTPTTPITPNTAARQLAVAKLQETVDHTVKVEKVEKDRAAASAAPSMYPAVPTHEPAANPKPVVVAVPEPEFCPARLAAAHTRKCPAADLPSRLFNFLNMARLRLPRPTCEALAGIVASARAGELTATEYHDAAISLLASTGDWRLVCDFARACVAPGNQRAYFDRVEMLRARGVAPGMPVMDAIPALVSAAHPSRAAAVRKRAMMLLGERIGAVQTNGVAAGGATSANLLDDFYRSGGDEVMAGAMLEGGEWAGMAIALLAAVATLGRNLGTCERTPIHAAGDRM